MSTKNIVMGPTFKEVMKYFNLTRPDGSIESEKRGPHLEPIDAYKLGKKIMELEKKLESIKSNKK